MAKQKQLQEIFLNAARKQHARMNIFLVNGIKLTGTIQSFDNYALMLSSKQGIQLVYKHAISTLAPDEELKLEMETQDAS